MTEQEMAWHLVNHFNPRANLCVPNLSWGMGFWEMDLAVLTASGYLKEIEIKVSLGDLRADKKKMKWQQPYFKKKFDEMISEYYIAVPHELADKIGTEELHPACAGLLSVNPDCSYSTGIVRYVRPSTKQRGRKLDDSERYQLA